MGHAATRRYGRRKRRSARRRDLKLTVDLLCCPSCAPSGRVAVLGPTARTPTPLSVKGLDELQHRPSSQLTQCPSSPGVALCRDDVTLANSKKKKPSEAGQVGTVKTHFCATEKKNVFVAPQAQLYCSWWSWSLLQFQIVKCDEIR